MFPNESFLGLHWLWQHWHVIYLILLKTKRFGKRNIQIGHLTYRVIFAIFNTQFKIININELYVTCLIIFTNIFEGGGKGTSPTSVKTLESVKHTNLPSFWIITPFWKIERYFSGAMAMFRNRVAVYFHFTGGLFVP